MAVMLPLLVVLFNCLWHVDSTQWQQAFVSCIKFLIVPKNEFYQLPTIDKSKIAFACLE
jgi:hypothetical protein